MEEVGHSPLLKYFRADNNIPTMSKPQIKLQVSVDDTIEAKVPGEQKLRKDSPKHVTQEEIKTNDDRATIEFTKNEEQSTKTNEDNAYAIKESTENVEIKDGEEEKQKIVDSTETEIATNEDFVLTPVMTVTKEEAVFTKGDLKLQKISVTEDISGTGTITTVTHERVTLTRNDQKEPDLLDEVFDVKRTETDIRSNGKQTEAKKAKTRIPTLRFRQAVDKLRRERRGFEEKKEPETPQPRRSSIPRFKDSRIPPPTVKDAHKVENTKIPPQVDDEFDKLYDDLVDQDSDDNLSIASKIEDPVKLENTFEEIIHAYEENKEQPINVEKVRNSKIPLLKRKSEQEIEVAKQASIKESVSLDSSTTKINTTEKHSKIQSVTLNKSPVKTTFVTQRVSGTKSVHESSTEILESFKTIKTATVEENNQTTVTKSIKKEKSREDSKSKDVKESKEETVTEVRETVKIATPVFVPLSNEDIKLKLEEEAKKTSILETQSSKTSEQSNTFNHEEKFKSKSVVTTSTTVGEVRLGSIKHSSSRSFEQKSSTETNIESQKKTEREKEDELEEENNPILRGKVSRILRRIDSLDTSTKTTKKDLGDDIPKTKSVLSKIAMFERPDTPETPPRANVRCISQIPRLKNDEPNEVKNNIPHDKPKVVDELLKAMPAQVIEDNNSITLQNDQDKPRDNSQMGQEVNENKPKNDHKFDIQIIDIQPKMPHINSTPEEFHPKDSTLESHIVETTSKVPIESINHVAVKEDLKGKKDIKDNTFSPDTKFNDDSKKGSVQTNNQTPDFSPAFVNFAASKESQNNAEINSKLYFSENRNYSSLEYHKTDYQPVYVDRGSDWITRKVTESAEIFRKDYSSYVKETKNESYVIQNRAEIVTNVHDKEVKFERINTSKKAEKEETKANDVFYRKIRKDEEQNKEGKTKTKDYDEFYRKIQKGDSQNKVEKEETKDSDAFYRKIQKDEGQLRIHAYRNNETEIKRKSRSLAELDLGDAVKGKVRNMVVRMNSFDKFDLGRKEIIDIKESPRKRSVSEKIALFEGKLSVLKVEKSGPLKVERKEVVTEISEEEYAKNIEDLLQAKAKYGSFDQQMQFLELRDGGRMPVIGLGTALLPPKLSRYVVQAAIDLGYRTIDTAFIYGNEREVGEAINEKIRDGTVVREDLFIISKLWSTFHRKDLVEKACRASLDAMGLEYFDLYLIHNPMSFKEGRDPIPKIASVIQFSEHDYLDAWYGIEGLVGKGLIRRGGVSNFNSLQLDRLLEKGKVKPVLNQVECHPYLSQNKLDDFCQARNVRLCCYGVLGSKGTPQEYKSALPPAIDDPLVRVMAAGMGVSPAVLLISYQLAAGRSVAVKAANSAHLADNLRALQLPLSAADVAALHALNRNKRNFTFRGMGDTHKNYPFNIPF